MFSPFSDSIKYSLGWFINDPVIDGKKRIFPGHTGGANGYKSSIIRGLDDNLLVVYLSNIDEYIEIRYSLVNHLISEN